MAYSRSRRPARRSVGGRRSNTGRGRVARSRTRSVRGNRSFAGARQQTVKLVLGFDPTAGVSGVFKPGIPGTVGIAANPPASGKAKF